MTSTQLIILDEVNIKFEGLDVVCRRKMVESLEFMLPYARHTPAYKLGRWNGKTSFCDVGARSYLNLLDVLLPIVQQYGYEIEIDDRRAEHNFLFDEINENSYSHITWPKGHTKADQPITLRDHQVEVINSYLSNITGINIAPTGSGKTLITAILSHKVQPYGRSIVIVPTKDLVTQTEDDYKNLGLDVGVFFGDRKEYLKTHTICTWQSLEVLAKKSKSVDLEIDINAFFEGVVCVMVDEVHKAKADVLRRLLSSYLANAPIRWGLTGTMPEEDVDKISVISCIGPMLGKINTKDLQDKGILAQLHVNIWQMQDLGEAAFDNYQSELKWLTTNLIRLKFLAKEIITISESGSTLILVDRIQTGEMLQSLIPDSIFVSGRMKSKDRKEEYAEVQEVDGKIIIATYGVASTGINIVRIFNLVLFEAGKSFTRVIQSIGRGIRVAPDKDFVNVYDVCSNCKFSKRHLTKRKKFYNEAEYPFTVKKVQY
ncbi:MAG TPA: DEAD/DEAH box helicase family protein [Ignavibacteriaceae bacterium]